ncbi:MAG: ATP-binding cassette domain-containing protein [Escherichia coli]|nr:ATP-binding cassette domain-containing protein [Escherichia coli]
MEQSVANLVDMRDVSFTRGNRCIFDNISLTVPRGKITAIMGPSGIGKTTLLRLIGGQIAPDHGEILFDGENIPAMSRSRLYTVRKRMSMLFQSGALFTDMNVTCVVVSHDVPEVLSIADHAWILADKKIVAHGSAQALQANPDPRVRQFLDGIADGPVPFRYPAGDYHADLLPGS